jgi:hypothetical protein
MHEKTAENNQKTAVFQKNIRGKMDTQEVYKQIIAHIIRLRNV